MGASLEVMASRVVVITTYLGQHMTIFQLIKLALDELYEEGRIEYGALQLDGQIKQRLAYLSASYRNLTDPSRQPIDYRDPATRFAYAYMYVAAHADYVLQVLQALENHFDGPIFDTEQVRVSCIGGGPGSDLVAVLKYLSEGDVNSHVSDVICYLLDGEQAWADTWTEVGPKLNVPFKLGTNFQPLDVTRPDSWRSQKRFLQADLFTMSYFASEVHALDNEGGLTPFWETLFDAAKPGALFLYVDNGHRDFNEYIDELTDDMGLQTVIGVDNGHMRTRVWERANEVRFYTDKFDKSPKLQGTVSYRVLRKP